MPTTASTSSHITKGITMSDTPSQREVVRRCLWRIERWQHSPVFAAQERDCTFFYSAFPGDHIPSHRIMRALFTLEEAGFIDLTFPRPDTEPDIFIIDYIPEKEP